MDRRQVLAGIAGATFAGTAPRLAEAAEGFLSRGLPPGEYDTAMLAALPGKKKLIKLSYRPPNYETPLDYLRTAITPNDAFFVRYHLAVIPEIDVKEWKLKVGGEAAATPLTLTMAELSAFPPATVTAVCQCAGARRGWSEPHVAGVEWGPGAVGNAVWKGARLKDVLGKAGLRKDAVEIVLDGADGPVLDKTPDFRKSIPVEKALDDNTLIAYEMNGAPLPHFNGFPARLIVPGWVATYWMKHITDIAAVTKPFDGFWMKGAYRIPTGKFPVLQHFLTQANAVNEPITEMLPNSLIASPAAGARVSRGAGLEVQGLAWDGGYGIDHVDVSTDGGATWADAELGKDLGRFSFREWWHRFTPDKQGKVAILARAGNRVGQSQVDTLIFNPAGYHNNVVRPTVIEVA
jgi:DMSO/TMAO reductase YedYZ molybdopterin-dependent catalytic subunit